MSEDLARLLQEQAKGELVKSVNGIDRQNPEVGFYISIANTASPPCTSAAFLSNGKIYSGNLKRTPALSVGVPPASRSSALLFGGNAEESLSGLRDTLVSIAERCNRSGMSDCVALHDCDVMVGGWFGSARADIFLNDDAYVSDDFHDISAAFKSSEPSLAFALSNSGIAVRTMFWLSSLFDKPASAPERRRHSCW